MNAWILFDIGLRATLIFAAAWLVVRAMGRCSAAQRHLVLAAALAVCVALPFGFLTLPEWAWKVRAASPKSSPQVITAKVVSNSSEASNGTAERVAPDAMRTSQPVIDGANALCAVLGLGMVAQAAWLLAGSLQLRGIRRRARRFEAPCAEHVEILISDEAPVAFLAGVLRPAIVLPWGAAGWPAEQLRMVLLHEIAHLRRRDHWMLPLCGAVRILYWWNPLAWVVLAQLRRERERACDDLVLAEFRASDYAALLVDAAKAAAAQRRPRAILAMATGSRIEERVCAVLDDSLPRAGAARGMIFGVLAITVIALGLLGTIRLAEANPPADPGAKPAATAASSTSAATAEQQVEIQTKFVDIKSAVAAGLHAEFDSVMNAKGSVPNAPFVKLIRALDQKKGVDLMSAPTVTSKPSNKVVINMVREFKYGVEFKKNADGIFEPTKTETRNVGVEVEMLPTIHRGKILLNGLMRMTKIAGWTGGDGEVHMPVFDVKEAHFLREVGDGETAGVWTWSHTDEQIMMDTYPDGSQVETKEQIDKRTAIFLTARLIGHPVANTASTPPKKSRAPTSARSGTHNLPYGTPVAGKPGFVTSPFAPDDGDVDVTGFPPNTEVKCPYTGKFFLVP